jgi:enterochelin esterase-like enzyme
MPVIDSRNHIPTRRVVVTLVCLGALTVSCGRQARARVGGATSTAVPSCADGVGRNVTARVDRRRILVHLPACYDDRPDQRYPTVYLIHGSGADETQWVDIGMTTQADRLTRAGTTAPSILVMPDEGASSSAQEAHDIVTRVLPWVDAGFRTIRSPRDRVIAGISRGGGAALRLGGSRADLFGAVGGHSATIPGDIGTVAQSLRPLDGHVRLDAGNSDPLRVGLRALANTARRDGITVIFEAGVGGHDRAYWRSQVPAYLAFYSSSWR